MGQCQTRDRLHENVQICLENLIELMQKQRSLIEIEAEATVLAIDKEIERTFGEKERAVGAFYEHRREHGC